MDAERRFAWSPSLDNPTRRARRPVVATPGRHAPRRRAAPPPGVRPSPSDTRSRLLLLPPSSIGARTRDETGSAPAAPCLRCRTRERGGGRLGRAGRAGVGAHSHPSSSNFQLSISSRTRSAQSLKKAAATSRTDVLSDRWTKPSAAERAVHVAALDEGGELARRQSLKRGAGARSCAVAATARRRPTRRRRSSRRPERACPRTWGAFFGGGIFQACIS